MLQTMGRTLLRHLMPVSISYAAYVSNPPASWKLQLVLPAQLLVVLTDMPSYW